MIAATQKLLTESEQARAWDRNDWIRIFKNITDPDIRAEKQRLAVVKRRQDERIKDTGLIL